MALTVAPPSLHKRGRGSKGSPAPRSYSSEWGRGGKGGGGRTSRAPPRIPRCARGCRVERTPYERGESMPPPGTRGERGGLQGGAQAGARGGHNKGRGHENCPSPLWTPLACCFAGEGGVEEGGAGEWEGVTFLPTWEGKTHTCCLRVVCFLLFTFIYYVIYP